MQIHQLTTTKTKKTRRGRGGKRGTYSGRGMKGQKARSGGNVDPLFEGGRSSLVQRMKKNRGFTSRKPSQRAVSLTALDNAFEDGDTVNRDALVQKKVIRKSQASYGVKIVGTGEISKKLTIALDIDTTKSAHEAIISAGGTITEDK